MLDPDTFETASCKREVGTNWNTAPAVDSGRGPRAVSGKPTPSRNILQTQNARRFAGISTESKESVGCRFWVTAKERWPTGAGIQLYQTVEPVVPDITLDACSEKETTSREWNWAQRWLDTDWARKKLRYQRPQSYPNRDGGRFLPSDWWYTRITIQMRKTLHSYKWTPMHRLKSHGKPNEV